MSFQYGLYDVLSSLEHKKRFRQYIPAVFPPLQMKAPEMTRKNNESVFQVFRNHLALWNRPKFKIHIYFINAWYRSFWEQFNLQFIWWHMPSFIIATSQNPINNQHKTRTIQKHTTIFLYLSIMELELYFIVLLQGNLSLTQCSDTQHSANNWHHHLKKHSEYIIPTTILLFKIVIDTNTNNFL